MRVSVGYILSEMNKNKWLKLPYTVIKNIMFLFKNNTHTHTIDW